MTPLDFQRAMHLICQGSDRAAVQREGVALINSALGDFAELYLGAVEAFFDRLREFERPSFGPPTVASIQAEAGEGAL